MLSVFAFAVSVAAVEARGGGFGGGRGGHFGGGGVGGGGVHVGGFTGGVALRGASVGGGYRSGLAVRPGYGVGGIGGARPGLGYRPGFGYRPGYGWRYRPGYGYAGYAPWLGYGLAVGGYSYYDDTSPDDYYEPAVPAYNGSVAYCAQRFRSYDPVSQTYLVYDGHRHSCP